MSVCRVAVVTGGNKGIGFAIVRALCKQFQGIVYLTARDGVRGTEAVKSLEKEGLNPKFHLLDVTDKDSIETLRDYLVKQYGGVDTFVHNAGIMQSSSIPCGEQARETIKVNFTGTLHVCNIILPIMKKDGRLVNLSSQLSISALAQCSKDIQDYFKSPQLTEDQLVKKLDEFVASAEDGEHKKHGFSNHAYGMSKIGVNALTRLASKKSDILNRNILVNCCCPGWVKTEMGGNRAPLTPDQGAVTPVTLALIPVGSNEPNGEFLQNQKIVNW